MPQHEPEISRSREVKLPKHPMGWECRHCQHYLKGNEYKAYILDNGMAVPESIARQQIPMATLAMAETTMESFCSLLPRWERVAAHHWCQKFEGR